MRLSEMSDMFDHMASYLVSHITFRMRSDRKNHSSSPQTRQERASHQGLREREGHQARVQHG
jgi:hypothetical protein